ncbi:MAG: hypothetical protein L0Y56_07960 [Nitrospira sp.]|nr:hypothetical protein [Nitrospira sp.]
MAERMTTRAERVRSGAESFTRVYYTHMEGYVVGFVVYWVWYVVARKRMVKDRFWRFGYLANMVFGVAMMLGLPLVLEMDWGLWLGVIGMVVGILVHHLTVWVKYTRWRRWYYSKIHGKISHILFFVSFGYVGARMGGVVAIVAVACAAMGVYSGFKKGFIFSS